jgi:RNA polymerase sigma factor for flagellar operon FliA
MNYSKNGFYQDELKYQKDQLAIEFLPAVKAMASRLKERLPSFVDYFDLVSTGTEELVKLSRRYDESQNNSFWGYAKQRVYGSMLDYLRSLDIISRNNRRLIKIIDIEIEKYSTRYGEEPTNEFLSKELNIPEKKIEEAKIVAEIYTLLPLNEENDYIDSKSDIYSIVERDDLIDRVKDILDDLQEREKLIMQLYYFEELSLKEVSKVLNVTESRISQLHKAIIKKIRDQIKE